MRAVLQSFLATDLGDVRVHTSPEAGAVLDEIGGDAATLGRTILMRPEFSHASTLPGRVLLLHELMHVAQQGRSPQLARPHELSHDETADGHEREAQRTALALATRSPQPMGATT